MLSSSARFARSDLSRANKVVSTLVASGTNGCLCGGAMWHYRQSRYGTLFRKGLDFSSVKNYSGCQVYNNFKPLQTTLVLVNKYGKRNIFMTTAIKCQIMFDSAAQFDSKAERTR